MKILQIKPNDQMLEHTLDTISVRGLAQVLKSLLNEETHKTLPKKLYTWTMDGYSVHCYGWWKGSAGQENKHELVPSGIPQAKQLDSSDTQLLFGSLFMIKQSRQIKDFSIEDYGEFYSTMIGGIDDCDSDETESDDDGSSLSEFIVDDSNDELSDDTVGSEDTDTSDTEVDESEMILDSDEELDEDTTMY